VGRWFWERGDLERSARAYRRLFAQRPGDIPEALRGLAREGLPLSSYEALIPERPAAWGAYAATLVEAGLWKEAQDAFLARVPADEASAPVHDRYADALAAAGQWGLEAVIRDRRLSARSDPAAHAAAARAWLKLGAAGRALDRVEKACLTDPGRAAWFVLRSEILLALGEPERALESLMRAAALAPLDDAPRRRRAALYDALKLPGPAAEDWRALLRTNPADREAAFGLAGSLERLGDAAGARRALEEYLEKAPDDAEARSRRDALKGR
jgi:tetratricopeptide (TPR) repeat protein